VYAIIRTGGRQVRVQQGDTVYVDRLQSGAGDTVTLGEVLMVGGSGDPQIGSPLLATASVTGTVVEQGRDHKIRVFKYKKRKHYRRTKGHRQSYTAVRIDSIQI
jgi:large subunit ribosomal protein L21